MKEILQILGFVTVLAIAVLGLIALSHWLFGVIEKPDLNDMHIVCSASTLACQWAPGEAVHQGHLYITWNK